ncbi:MAG: hypothetical protein WHS89_08685 [Acidimicrobiales bacterium]|jgi:alpha-L-fucosidase
MVRRSMALLALVFGLVGLAAPAHAQDYPPQPGITVDKPNVSPGGTVTVSGQGCSSGASVSIQFNGQTVATATAGQDGSFSASITVPAGTPAGTYQITAVNCTTQVLSTSITVGGATTPTTAPSVLPRTGSDATGTLARVGVALVAVGGLLAFAARRRTASEAR